MADKKGSLSNAAATLGKAGRAVNSNKQAIASRKNGKKNTGEKKPSK
jgi:hypothetical protein